MTKKRDDQHGYDPERAAARSLFDRLERQAEQRPDKGHGNDSDTEGTHHRKLMQEPPLAAAGVH